MQSRSKRIYFSDFMFNVDENVYAPMEDSFLLAKNLEVESGQRVLDVGTGCGIQAVVAASKGALALATDVNPYAVRCAKRNARLNNVSERICFVRGDLLQPIRSEKMFDIVLFNAPYLPVSQTEDPSWLARSWAGGPSGRDLIDRFIHQVSNWLVENGYAFLVQSTLSGLSETLRQFEEEGLSAWVQGECTVPFFETIVVVRAERRNRK